MPRIQTRDLSLWYESFPPTGDEVQPYPLLLICGFGMQAIHWPEPLLDALRAQGFRVIIFDNRDIGLSDRVKGKRAPAPAKIGLGRALGRVPEVPYLLDDMADDAAALLDALEIEKANIVGMSMGGMIAQLVALRHPDRTASLCSWASMPGRLSDLLIHPKMIPLMLKPVSKDPEERIEDTKKMWAAIGTRAFPSSVVEIEDLARRSVERAPDESGIPRQFAAILASPSRVGALRALKVPTLVVHGDADPLVPRRGGKRVAKVVPDARLRLIRGYGHNLPPELMEQIAEEIALNAARAR